MKEMFGRWEIEEGELKVAVVFDGYEDVEMKRRSLAWVKIQRSLIWVKKHRGACYPAEPLSKMKEVHLQVLAPLHVRKADYPQVSMKAVVQLQIY